MFSFSLYKLANFSFFEIISTSSNKFWYQLQNGDYGTIWYGAIWYGAIWYGAIWYGASNGMVQAVVWYSAVQWYGVMVHWSNGRGMVQHGVRQDDIGQSPGLSNLARFQN